MAHSRNENGIVVVLFVMLSLILVGFIAFAIEMTLAASSVQRAKSYAQFAALAALEEYFTHTSKFPASTNAERLEAALQRANEIAKFNVLIGGANSQELQGDNVSGLPRLVPGRFFFKPLADGTNPCLTGDSAPCFVPLQTGETPNAFRIAGQLYQAVKLHFGFAAFGIRSWPVNVDATAALVPRHGCFLVDMSVSMVRDTHKKAGESAGEYNYFLRADNPGAIAADDDAGGKWLELLAKGDRPAWDASYLHHYTNDYRLVSNLRTDASYNAEDELHHPSPAQSDEYKMDNLQNYQVDQFCLGRPDCPSPQPLTDVLAGLDVALGQFQQRAVAGDKACLIFYDQGLKWPRFFKLTDDFEYLRKFSKYFDTGSEDSGIRLAWKHGIFPFRKSKTNSLKVLTAAMAELEFGRADGIPSSDFMVIIGDGQSNCSECPPPNPRLDYNHDGKMDSVDQYNFYACYYPTSSYCQNLQYYPAIKVCPLTAASCAWADTDNDGVVGGDADDYSQFSQSLAYYNSCLNGCSNKYEYYYQSMEKIRVFARDSAAKRNVAIHVMLIGKESGPHTVDVAAPNDPTRCLTEAEKRQRRTEGSNSLIANDTVRGYMYDWILAHPTYASSAASLRDNYPSCSVSRDTSYNLIARCYPPLITGDTMDIGKAWMDRSETKPFVEINDDWYRIATLTGGLWAPIRPTSMNGEVCVPGACDPSQPRRYTDPNCDDQLTQIAKYMKEIMGRAPYTLVHPSGSLPETASMPN